MMIIYTQGELDMLGDMVEVIGHTMKNSISYENRLFWTPGFPVLVEIRDHAPSDPPRA